MGGRGPLPSRLAPHTSNPASNPAARLARRSSLAQSRVGGRFSVTCDPSRGEEEGKAPVPDYSYQREASGTDEQPPIPAPCSESDRE